MQARPRAGHEDMHLDKTGRIGRRRPFCPRATSPGIGQLTAGPAAAPFTPISGDQTGSSGLVFGRSTATAARDVAAHADRANGVNLDDPRQVLWVLLDHTSRPADEAIPGSTAAMAGEWHTTDNEPFTRILRAEHDAARPRAGQRQKRWRCSKLCSAQRLPDPAGLPPASRGREHPRELPSGPSPTNAVERRDGSGVGLRQGVEVVLSGLDTAVPEAFLDDLEVSSAREEPRRVSVAKVVNADVEVKLCHLQGGQPHLLAEPVTWDVAVGGHDTASTWLVLAFRAASPSIVRVCVPAMLAVTPPGRVTLSCAVRVPITGGVRLGES